jgi:hypothetical protein
MDLASTVLTADQALNAAADQWKIVPVTKKPIVEETTVWIAVSKPQQTTSYVPPRSDSGNGSTSEVNNPNSAGPPQNLQDAINTERDRIDSVETVPLGGELFDSDQVLSEVGKPYEIKDVFGPAQADKQFKIIVAPGVEIRGGKINLESPNAKGDAAITFAGSKSKPIILRHVEIDHPLQGRFKASNVIFDQCSFRKTGGWYAYYSSKWEMDQCLLYKCDFPNFKGVDYGFKFTNCTFVSMNLPEISHDKDNENDFDYMTRLRKDWNIIQSCSFVNCTVFPTVFWCSETSNFWNCAFLPGVAFNSATPTKVSAYVSGTNGETPAEISHDNPPKRAPLTIVQHAGPFPVLRWPVNLPIPEISMDQELAKFVLGRG